MDGMAGASQLQCPDMWQGVGLLRGRRELSGGGQQNLGRTEQSGW